MEMPLLQLYFFSWPFVPFFSFPPFSQTVLPSKAIRNEKILETLMVQANSGMYRVQDSYLEACQRMQKQDSRYGKKE